jgi:23S rRNA pseudouridine2604 synthase
LQDISGMNNKEEGIQLNKYISSSGYCSRREADNYIEQGRVTVNDNVAVPGMRIAAGDEVAVDGEFIKVKKSGGVYLAFNKPTGITSTTDPKDRTNIINYINYPKRIFPIGRLDKDSEGLILLTNDGDIVNKILRAGNEHEKEYIVTVNKPLGPDFARRMSAGLPILGETTKPCTVRTEGPKKFRIILTQGLNRQIRRMCEHLGYDVITLRRVRIMNITLDKLDPGKWRPLSQTEIASVKQMLNSSSKTEEASASVKAPAPVREKAPFRRPAPKRFVPGKGAPAYKRPSGKKEGDTSVPDETTIKPKRTGAAGNPKKVEIRDKPKSAAVLKKPSGKKEKPAARTPQKNTGGKKAVVHKADKKASRPAKGRNR